MSSIIKYLVSHTMLSSIMWNVWRCGLSLQVYGCFLAVFLLLIFNSIACGQRVWSVLCSWYHIFGSISGAAGDLCSFFRALPSTGFHSIPITHSSSNRLALVYGGLPWAACHAVLSRTVMSDSLRPRGLQPTRLLCPFDSPGRNIGVGCHALSRGSSQPRDGSQVSSIAGGFFTIWATRESLVISLLITKGQDTFYKIKMISETFFTAYWAF